ncbi:response regulator transcription factor [Actinoplanes sp. NPDC023714]|uniref:response regulator transcription factor n=1 Tax=Actinoplanes sp. NPDC023714 TaxID=3154322 RepID=UPI0033D543F4
MRAGIRVVIIDDHDLFVRGLELLLPHVSGGRATVVGTTGDAAYAASVVRHAVPDVVLVNLHMPPPGGLHAVDAVRRAAPRATVLAMSGDDDPAVAIGALRAGAAGFLPKSSDAASLLPPLIAAVEGWSVMPPALLAALAGPDGGQSPPPVTQSLGDAERELLVLIASGASTTVMAARMHVSERTAKRLTAALLRKLRVASRAEAAMLAGAAGMLREVTDARMPRSGPLNQRP